LRSIYKISKLIKNKQLELYNFNKNNSSEKHSLKRRKYTFTVLTRRREALKILQRGEGGGVQNTEERSTKSQNCPNGGGGYSIF
jgi:hypothetical protein